MSDVLDAEIVAVEVDADFGLVGRAYWSHEFLLKYESSEISGEEYRAFKKDVQQLDGKGGLFG